MEMESSPRLSLPLGRQILSWQMDQITHLRWYRTTKICKLISAIVLQMFMRIFLLNSDEVNKVSITHTQCAHWVAV